MASVVCLKHQKHALSPNEAVKMASAVCLTCQKSAVGPNEAVKIARKIAIIYKEEDGL